WTTWLTHVAAVVAIPLIVFVGAPPARPQDIFVVYPLWAVSGAAVFLAFASEWGVYYAVGTICFLVAGLMALLPTWSPPVVGIFSNFNLTVQGWSRWGLGRQ